MKKTAKTVWTYILFILIPLAVGGFASLLTMDAMRNFENIAKPEITPPAILFPIVWTVLYILMGIGAGLVATAKSKHSNKRTSLAVWAFQLALNFLWTLVFFGARQYLTAFILLILLWLVILIMILSFASIRSWAGYMQIPYLLWVTFAGYLNYMIWQLN